MFREGRYRAAIESRSSFPADVASAGEARRYVRRVLAEWSAERYIDAATLAVSELVTNAVLHARSGPVVTLRLEDGRLRVEVQDDSAVTPSRKRYGPEAGTGRGLMLVESIAVAWGCDTAPGGKSVWFELDPGAGEAVPAVDFQMSEADLAELGEPPPRSDRRQRGGTRRPGQPVDRHHRAHRASVGGPVRS